MGFNSEFKGLTYITLILLILLLLLLLVMNIFTNNVVGYEARAGYFRFKISAGF